MSHIAPSDTIVILVCILFIILTKKVLSDLATPAAASAITEPHIWHEWIWLSTAKHDYCLQS